MMTFYEAVGTFAVQVNDLGRALAGEPVPERYRELTRGERLLVAACWLVALVLAAGLLGVACGLLWWANRAVWGL
jgi:hypothetical protein